MYNFWGKLKTLSSHNIAGTITGTFGVASAFPIFTVFALFIMTLSIALDPIILLANDRQRVIDFEDDVVEGVNKRPLDSVQQLSDGDRRKKRSHLYRKRSGFKDEIEQAFSQLRYR